MYNPICLTQIILDSYHPSHTVYTTSTKSIRIYEQHNLFLFLVSVNDTLSNLTFMRPCIVIYLYSKTNQMHQCIKLFYFGMTIYMFGTVFPSIIRSSRLYIQQQAYVKQILLPACRHMSNRYCCLLASKQTQYLFDICLLQYVQS